MSVSYSRFVVTFVVYSSNNYCDMRWLIGFSVRRSSDDAPPAESRSKNKLRGRRNMPPPPASVDLQAFPFGRYGCVKRTGGLDLRPFDLGSGAECHPWHGSTFRPCWSFCDLSLSSYRQTRIELTLRYDLDL